MFEGFAAWILNTYIGDYFGNVNRDQLRMSLNSGEIELERLPLKRDLIKHLGLPLEAKTGYIGKISIKFPSWNLFASDQPLVITIQDLFLIVKPITNFTYNEEEENRAQQEFKISQLDQLESRWKALHEDLTEQSAYASSYSSWLAYGSSLINNVLLNIHLNITSVHLRYEDHSTVIGSPFATGVVIRSIAVCSTDNAWEPKYVTRTERGLLFKLIEMESFSVYCDTDTVLFGNFEFDRMVDFMRQTLEKNLNRKYHPVEHGYIIAPVNGKCRLTRNCSEMSLKSCRQPRTAIDVQLEQVPIMMTAIQYKHLLDWSLAFNTSKTLWRYRKWRPMIRPKRRRTDTESEYEEDDEDEDDHRDPVRFGFEPKIWWHFAVNANLEEYRQRRQRFNWHFILQRARDIVSYHKAYLAYLVQPELFSRDMKMLKDRVETELSLDEICSIREIVFNQSDQLLKQQKLSLSPNQPSQTQSDDEGVQSSGYSSWWFPFLYYGYGYSTITSPESSLPETPKVPEIKEPEETEKPKAHRRSASGSSLSFQPDDIFLTRDAIFCQFNFQINNSSFQLIAFDSDSTVPDMSFLSAASTMTQTGSGNLLLEFEFKKMKISIDVTNPNAYSCVCHMNQRYRRMQATEVADSKSNSSTMMTQNELNQLQLNLNFECQNLNLTLLRAEHAIISDDDAQKLATAQLTGCGLMLVCSSHMVGIDGKMDSLELIDLVTAPGSNKHRRVLSIGRKNLDDQTINKESLLKEQMSHSMEASSEKSSENNDSRQMNRSMDETLNMNLELSQAPGSLPLVNSLVDSSTLDRRALSFSLSRQLNENLLRFNIEMASFCYVHSAILVYELSLCRKCFTDVLEAYFSRSFKEKVKAATTEMLRGIVNKAEISSDGSISINTSVTSTPSPSINNATPKANRFFLFDSNQQPKSRNRKQNRKSNSPFVDNFKLNVFIRSPVIIFPISPASFEVVVFHLGHMLLNNHHHSSELIQLPVQKFSNRSKKLSPLSNTSPHYNNFYNAEIRDLSVYSLNCSKNLGDDETVEIDRIPIEQFYSCEAFGVPILQKTIIEIVLERKILLSKDVTSKKISQGSDSNGSMIDGLNIISSVNSIDSILPKKFSIRNHFASDVQSFASNDKVSKSELVLSIEIPAIDVRFSYTDLLVFWHILNTLSPKELSLDATLNIADSGLPISVDEIAEVLRSIPITDLDLDEFRQRINKLIDLGFDANDSLRALSVTSGDVIEAAFLLSNTAETAQNASNGNEVTSQVNSSDDNHSQCTTVSDGPLVTSGTESKGSSSAIGTRENSKKKKKGVASQNSNLLLSLLSMIEVRIANGSIRIIDDCNKLDIPLLELGVRDFRLMQYYTTPAIEAHAQTNFYCDYYNSHLSGWEPFIEHCAVAFSWKMHEPRCHLKSMLPLQSASGLGKLQIARRKLALKIDIKKMFNLNLSRTLLDLVERVQKTWVQDIINFVNLPTNKRSFRHRKPFIPFALKNDTGSELQLFVSGRQFSTGKAADLITHCDLRPTLEVGPSQTVYFDLVDFDQRSKGTSYTSRYSRKSASTAFKISVKVDGWIATFPVSIEREGSYIRHIINERYCHQSAILVFDIELQSSAVKLITVRSSLLVRNLTTKTVELKFANTAMSDVKTSYLISSSASFPVPLDLLYARIQLRPCDLGVGACSSPIVWNHVKKFGETHCSLQICTPITHTSHASYSKSTAYVVTVQVERNSIGALIERHPSDLNAHQLTLPSHTITLLPPLQLANRLPYELKFLVSGTGSRGTIKSGEDYSVHYISPLDPFQLEFQMEHFPTSKSLQIQPGAIKSYTSYLDMYDHKGRLLVLHAHVSIISGSGQPCQAMTITIYAPYWIVNRSGLPLIFSQEDCSVEAAGQGEEHERARSISPLLFSFSDPEAPNCAIMRLGRISPNHQPRWCNFFFLEKGDFYRRLRVTEFLPDQHCSVEKIYEFGIDIRNGRDRYQHTKIVTIAPRYQIENLTSFKLEFAQKCQIESQVSSTSGLVETGSFVPNYYSSPVKSRTPSLSIDPIPTHVISALPKSNMPFHWPSTDKPKLLSVRIASIIGCLWSGSFDVGSEPSVSFHLNIRDDGERSYFIRVEILLQNATYFIVFTDANQLPPPIRVENFSQVAIEFYQPGSSHRTQVRPNSSVPYALDEPTKPSHITVCAPGGSHSTYDLNSFAPGDNLTYDNFYYLAFEETFVGTGNMSGSGYLDEDEQLMYMMLTGPDLAFGLDPISFSTQMLVFDVPDEEGQPKPVVLARKERGKRSQLWRIDAKGRIVHEGSSPPLEPSGPQDFGFAEVKFGSHGEASLMVLDVGDDFANITTSIPLTVRKLDHFRSLTQTWKFTEDGRLCCLKYPHLFVQPFALKDSEPSEMFRVGALAILAPGPLDATSASIPKEQAILKQKMRKGSGVLNMCIVADGPSRVLRIKDNQMSANGRHLNLVQYYGANVPVESSGESFWQRLLNQNELELTLQIDSIGISLISRKNEEIVYIYLRRILLELACNPNECRANCVVQDFQVDNQLRDLEKEVVLHVAQFETTPTELEIPAIMFKAHRLFIPNVETNVFKSLQVSINDLVFNIEEVVLLKLLEFIKFDPVDSEMDEISSTGSGSSPALLYYHASRNVTSALSRSAQYYFAYLLIQLSRVKLSVFTSTSKLSRYLSELKKKAGIKLIRFEEALIHLRPFHKVYSLMTARFLQDSIKEHYRSELRSQAAKILGTVDFLGNPVGFLNNVAEGLNELMEGSVSGLILNVTHGISDSTAKVTSVLSESLGSVTLDPRYQEIRRKIKQSGSSGGGSHLVAGAFGLAHGLLGGITSVITQTYDGVVTHGGITGLLSGFGKGVLGTFTKPAVGMLDFASGAATAVRDSSRKAWSGERSKRRVRLPRTLTIDGRLTTYQWSQAVWQSRFYESSDFGSREHGEQFVHVFTLADHHFLLLTTERLFFFHSTLRKSDLPTELEDPGTNSIESCHHSNLASASILQLQILPLEHFAECTHYQIRLPDAQHFIRQHGAQQSCLNFSRELSHTNSYAELRNFIEFRTTTSNSNGRPANSPKCSLANGPATVASIQYPKHLSLCYVYCDSDETVAKLVLLVNQAKHYQEERKFEVRS